MRRMKQTLLVAAIVFATVGVAQAGGQPGSLGVGAEFQLSGVGGLSLNYDTGSFHVGGFVGLDDAEGDDNTEIEIGGRFYYHVHSTASSDFSIGGSLGVLSDPVGPDERDTLLFIEPTLQIRSFITSNVALSFTAGFSIGAADASDLVITGDLVGLAGVHYYFF